MEKNELREKLAEEMRTYMGKADELRRQVEELDAEMDSDWQKSMLGKCFMRDWGGDGNYLTFYRIEYFTKNGGAVGTSLGIGDSGHWQIYADGDLHNHELRELFNVGKPDERGNPLVEISPELFATIETACFAVLMQIRDEFNKNPTEWKTKRQDLTTNSWMRLQPVLSSMAQRSKRSEKEKLRSTTRTVRSRKTKST